MATIGCNVFADSRTKSYIRSFAESVTKIKVPRKKIRFKLLYPVLSKTLQVEFIYFWEQIQLLVLESRKKKQKMCTFSEHNLDS